MMLSRLFYDLFIRSYNAAAALASPFSSKARRWKQGRQNWRETWKDEITRANAQQKRPVVWMHAASLGEYEQGLPLLQEIKKRWPGTCTVVSFFSPSGMEHAAKSDAVDVKQYLPPDKRRNASHLLDLLKPQLVLWVKYEYWFHYINAIHQRNIPLFLISGTFQPHQPFFKWYGGLHREMLVRFDKLFVQRQEDAELAKQLVPAKKIVVSGDTRFDKVMANARKATSFPVLEEWLKFYRQVLVAGSTWLGDEKLLAQAANVFPQTAFIVVPHNVGPEDIKATGALFKTAMLYSIAEHHGYHSMQTNTMIVDRVGMLKSLYGLGHVAFIGGGFTSDGVHNVPEAAAYGKPVLHGPNFSKYKEVVEMVRKGASVVVSNAEDLQQELILLREDEERQRRGNLAQALIEAGSGATQIVADHIQEKRLLTSE